MRPEKGASLPVTTDEGSHCGKLLIICSSVLLLLALRLGGVQIKALADPPSVWICSVCVGQTVPTYHIVVQLCSFYSWSRLPYWVILTGQGAALSRNKELRLIKPPLLLFSHLLCPKKALSLGWQLYFKDQAKFWPVTSEMGKIVEFHDYMWCLMCMCGILLRIAGCLSGSIKGCLQAFS